MRATELRISHEAVAANARALRARVPDGVKVGSVSLSPRGDWRMPSDASAALWLEQAENL